LWAQVGVYANLLVPLAFYVLARLTMPALAALGALAAFLFLNSPTMDLASEATYSPWIWPDQFAQGLMYATASCWLLAVRSGLRRWEIATGVLMGLTFLGHVAPALVLAGAFVIHTSWSLWKPGVGGRMRALRRLGTCAGISALLAVPLLLPLVIRYGLRLKNDLPARGVFISRSQIIRAFMRPRGFVACLGVVAVLRHVVSRPGHEEKRILFALGSASLVALMYGLFVAFLDRRGMAHLPMPVPSFHFHLYLTAIESLFFGIGLFAIVHVTLGTRSWRIRTLVFLAAAAVLVGVAMPGYLRRDDVLRWPPESRRLADDETRETLYRWARQSLPWGEVTLASRYLSMHALVPADRQVVGLLELESSPYVLAHQRRLDQEEMFRALKRHDEIGCFRLANAYGVTHVVSARADDDDCCTLTGADIPASFGLVLDHAGLRVYNVSKGAEGGGSGGR
jgi:hypothetical protein